MHSPVTSINNCTHKSPFQIKNVFGNSPSVSVKNIAFANSREKMFKQMLSQQSSSNIFQKLQYQPNLNSKRLPTSKTQVFAMQSPLRRTASLSNCQKSCYSKKDLHDIVVKPQSYFASKQKDILSRDSTRPVYQVRNKTPKKKKQMATTSKQFYPPKKHQNLNFPKKKVVKSDIFNANQHRSQQQSPKQLRNTVSNLYTSTFYTKSQRIIVKTFNHAKMMQSTQRNIFSSKPDPTPKKYTDAFRMTAKVNKNPFNNMKYTTMSKKQHIKSQSKQLMTRKLQGVHNKDSKKTDRFQINKKLMQKKQSLMSIKKQQQLLKNLRKNQLAGWGNVTKNEFDEPESYEEIIYNNNSL